MRLLKYNCLVLVIAVAGFNKSAAQNQTNIALNQLGFFPDAPKVAIVSGKTTGKFLVQTTAGKVVFSGRLKASGNTDFAGIKTALADFSAFHQTGTYRIAVAGLAN